MIPWQDFENRSQFEWEGCRADLCEYLLEWVERGPTMAEFLLNSPMLELAHERRFVVTQQGWNNDDFALEHTGRIEACLTALDNHFHAFATTLDESSLPPPDVDHVGLWVPHRIVAVSPDEMLQDMLDAGYEQIGMERSIATTSPTPRRSHLERPRTPAVPSLIIEDSEFSDELEEQLQVIADAYRTGRSGSRQSSRARKRVRQRISSSKLDSKCPNVPGNDGSPASDPLVRNFKKPTGSIFTYDARMQDAFPQTVDSVEIHSSENPIISDNI